MTDIRFATTPLTTGPHVHYAEQGDAGGEPLVFLHGWPDSWFTWSRVLPLLPPTLHVFALDQRGFGDSDRPAGSYSIGTFAADVVAFLDAVGIASATIVGHSFGSFVTRCTAIRHPDRVTRMVLIGTGAAGSNEVTRAVKRDMAEVGEPVPEAFARSFQAGTAYVRPSPAFFDRVIVESLKLPARLWHGVFDAILAYDDAAEWPGIQTPTLLLWGDRDALFSRTEQDRLATALPHATLEIYPDIGHCPNWECPERVAADIRAFVHGR